jgi:hypothetical protein
MSLKVKKSATGGAGGEGTQNPNLKKTASGAAGDAGEGNGGGDEGDGGEGDESGDEQDDEQEEPRGKKIDLANHRRALDDLNKIKRENAKLRQEAKERGDNELKAQNRWKELAEERERERDEANERAEKIQNAFVNERKYSAVKTEAMAKGLLPSAIDDLESADLDLVDVETTSKGKINVLGVSEQVQKIMKTKPHWFGQGAGKGKGSTNVNSRNPGVNGDTGGGDGASVTMDQLRALEKQARKSGSTEDKAKYHQAANRYRLSNTRRTNRDALR